MTCVSGLPQKGHFMDLSDAEGDRGASMMGGSSVAPFASGEDYAAALGRPGGARRQNRTQFRAFCMPPASSYRRV
jgi:hypothetical protein